MKIRYLFILGLLGLVAHVKGQDTIPEKKTFNRFSVGLNITDAVSNLINVADNATSIDPYTFSFQLLRKKVIYRFGLRVKFKQDKSDLFPSNGTRDVSFLDIQGRFGFQKNIRAFKKLDIFWGIDGVVGYENDISESITNSDKLRNIELLFSGGLGPILGFQYHFSERFSVSTYSTLYYVYSYKNSELRDFNSGGLIEATNEYIHEVEHILPNSIYFHFRF